jgi:hypothetical protein
MRRASLIVSAFAIVLVGLIGPGRTGPSAAQDATPMADGQGLVGSWRLTVTERQAPPFLAFGTFGADGTLVVSSPPVVPPSPRGPGSS